MRAEIEMDSTKAVLTQFAPKDALYKHFGLTQKQFDWCEQYLRTGSQEAANKLWRPQTRKAQKITDLPNVQAYLSARRKQLRGLALDDDETRLAAESYDTHRVYYSTIRTLSQIIDACVPPDATTPQQMQISDALDAIAERNKMMGLYAPERSINTQIQIDSERIKQTLDALEAEYEREC